MAAPALVLAACAALGPPAAAAAVRRRAGAVELLSLSPKFDRLFPDGVVGEVALAEGRNAAGPLRWLEGPTWLEEPGGAAGEGEDVRATVLVSDVIGNRIWRWREPAFTPREGRHPPRIGRLRSDAEAFVLLERARRWRRNAERGVVHCEGARRRVHAAAPRHLSRHLPGALAGVPPLCGRLFT